MDARQYGTVSVRHAAVADVDVDPFRCSSKKVVRLVPSRDAA
jgi:hypothetical protein